MHVFAEVQQAELVHDELVPLTVGPFPTNAPLFHHWRLESIEYKNALRKAKARGASAAELFAIKEKFMHWANGVEVKNWGQWVATFQPEIFDEPKVFILNEDQPYDYSSPIQAVRSFEQAIYFADSAALLSCGTEDGAKLLDRAFSLTERIVGDRKQVDTYSFPPFTDKISVLLSARMKYTGTKELVLVMYRVESSQKPKEWVYKFNTVTFEYDGETYRYTNIAQESIFGQALAQAGLRCPGGYGGRWLDFVECCKNSDLPRHFYEDVY